MDENPYKSPQTSETARLDDDRSSSSTRAGRPEQPTFTTHDIFGIVVRSVGLVVMAWGFWEACGMVRPAPGYGRIEYLISALPVLIIGGVFLFAADAIVAMAYRFPENDDDDHLDDG